MTVSKQQAGFLYTVSSAILKQKFTEWKDSRKMFQRWEEWWKGGKAALIHGF